MTERAGRQGSWFHGLAVIGPSSVHFPGGETVSPGQPEEPTLGHDPKHETFVTALVLGNRNGSRAGAGQLWVAGTSLWLNMETFLFFLDLTVQTALFSREHEELVGYML